MKLAALACALAACSSVIVSKASPPLGDDDFADIPATPDLDILLVIDNSSSMQDKQEVFSSSISSLVTALDAFPTGRPNLHIGVVNTTVDLGGDAYASSGCPSPDPADNGKLQTGASGCGISGSFISDVADASGHRTTNYGSDLATALGCIADVGVGGCEVEAPLDAMMRALDGSIAANAGFIRPSADLAIVVLTDEDDASVKAGSAGYDVFTLPAASVGGDNDFRVQPLFAYQCDQPLTAGSGSAAYTSCRPRTDSYLEDPVTYASFLTTAVKDAPRTFVAIIAAPPPQDINGDGFATNDATPQTAGTANGTGVPVFGGDGKTIETGDLESGISQDPALLPSCAFRDRSGAIAIGRPGVRLADFEQQFQNHGTYYTICQNDYSNALTVLGTMLVNAISPCLEGALDQTDEDPHNPGLQLDCEVSAIHDLGGPDETATRLLHCQMSDPSTPIVPASGLCWWVEQSDPACTGAADDGLSIHFDGSAGSATGDIVQVECALVSQ